MPPITKRRKQVSVEHDCHVAPAAVSNLEMLPKDMLIKIHSFFRTTTLVRMKQVNRAWEESCIAAIEQKLVSGRRRSFQTSKELRYAVALYGRVKSNDDDNAEKFATTYGFPINKWDVSKLTDLSYVFWNLSTFNEDVSCWDTSNATNMRSMFAGATKFNQDLSSWDIKRVNRMCYMFFRASSFNHDLTTWDLTNIHDTARMFHGATKFNSKNYAPQGC